MSYEAAKLDLESHRADLVRLLTESLPVGTPDQAQARIDWFYGQNPGGSPTTVLGIHSETRAAVGCGSFFPRTLHVPIGGGRWGEVRAGILCDFSVTKAHRTAGAAIAIQRALAKGSLEAGFTFLFGSPNQNALAVFKRVGYKHLGDSVTYVKPLRSRSFLEKRGAPKALASAGALAADPLLATNDLRLMLPTILTMSGDVVGRADGSFDDLWARARRGFVSGERSSAYLNWRYSGRQAKFEMFRLRERMSGRLFGYAVFCDKNTHAEVVDVFAEHLEQIHVVLLHLAQELRRRRTQTLWLSMFGAGRFEGLLTRIGFVKRDRTRPVYAYFDKNLDEKVRESLADRHHWFMLDGELDI